MRREFRRRGIVAALALILLAVPVHAIASELDEAKKAGSVGERPDGYEIAGMALIMAGLTALAVQQFMGDRRKAKQLAEGDDALDELPPAE